MRKKFFNQLISVFIIIFLFLGLYLLKDMIESINNSDETENLSNNISKEKDPSLYQSSDSKEAISYPITNEINPTSQETEPKEPMKEEKAYSMGPHSGTLLSLFIKFQC